MIHNYLLLIVGLIFAVIVLVIIGQKIKVSYPIFLVISGLLISFVPGIPHFRIDPELIFLLFLPPILYEAAWYTSWHDFWKWKRPISLLAFGLVFFTSTVVAFVTQSLIPGFTLALGFLLGGIIAPPDAVAATSVLKGIKIPKRTITILEGESLVNDASSLIVFKFALVAVITGFFSKEEAISDFFLLAIMGIIIGLAVAVVIYLIHYYLPTTASIDTALTLITPYIMFILAEHFHYSGVLAVVSGGLFLSYNSHKMLTHQSRIQATNVWHTLIFIINGIIFILIGLELPVVMENMTEITVQDGIIYGIIISLIIIAIRFIWTYIIAFVPRAMFKSIREKEKSPGWKSPFIISFAAMRGVVSLAAALSIPVLLPSGEGFPHRSTILFVTFVVILITLVGQGLLLPLVIKLIKIDEIDPILPEEEQETQIQLRLNQMALKELNNIITTEYPDNELLQNLKHQLENDIENGQEKMNSFETNENCVQELSEFYHIQKKLLQLQRFELVKIRKEKIFSDEVIRKQANLLDLNEAKLE